MTPSIVTKSGGVGLRVNRVILSILAYRLLRYDGVMNNNDEHNPNETDDLITFCVEDDEIGERLDKVITARIDDVSRNVIQQLIKEGAVQVNQLASKPSYKLEPGDCVTVKVPPEDETEILPEDIPLDIVYEDEMLAVINKPAGLVVHPGPGNPEGTLVNALLARWPHIGEVGDEPERSGIVHRLDKDTSGLIVVALTDDARENLMTQFKSRTTEKIYTALTDGHPPNDKGRIEAPIGRDPHNRKRMAVVRDGKEAVTEFWVRELYRDHALMDVAILTGRTHQIRVHLAFINCPVVGDTVYGRRKQRVKMKRVFLHAARLGFDHPVTGERVVFAAGLPTGLQNVLEKLPK
jgi:23S rRNA pseudouridine1911/1915/1917 synthase